MEKIFFDYTNFRSQLILKYNINLDETTASILFAILEEQSKSFDEQQKVFDKAIKRISDESNSLMVDNANPSKQAFWYGMGRLGLAYSLGIILLAITTMYFFSQRDEIKKLSNELKEYKIYYERTQKVNQRKSK